MKDIRWLFFFILIFFYRGIAYSQIESPNANFKLAGTLHGINTKQLHLYYMDASNKLVSDSCVIVNGHFSFWGKLKIGEPTWATIQ